MKAVASLLKNRLFVFTTAIPTLLASVYFGFYASDIYISESRFVVRSQDTQAASPLGLVFKGAGLSKTQDDVYVVHDYITSRDALAEIDRQLKIKDFYSSGEVDVFSRFSAIDWDDSFEAFYVYFKKYLDIQVDSVSSITTLTVKSFRAREALEANLHLIELAEALINKLNERSRQDVIKFATDDVALAEARVQKAGSALAAFRNEKGVIDPEKQSVVPLQQIAKLQDELIALKAQLLQVSTVAANNPQVGLLKSRIKLLEGEIDAENRKVVGGGRSLAGKAAEYSRLVLEKEFADKMLASAMSSLEHAKSEAQRKQIYLDRIAQPKMPDKAMQPFRLRSIVSTFFLGLVTWGILSMLLAGVREHYD